MSSSNDNLIYKPIYVAAANNGVVANAFKERDIAFLMPGAVDDCPITIRVAT